MKAFFSKPVLLTENCAPDERKSPNKPKGTYAALRLHPESAKAIGDYLNSTAASKITGPLPVAKMHCTLIYSRKHHPDMEPQPNVEYEARCKGFAVFHKSLVMLLDAEHVEGRHSELMQKHGCTYDFASYNPHVSIAYGLAPGFSPLDLPAFTGRILLTGEYTEDLNDD